MAVVNVLSLVLVLVVNLLANLLPIGGVTTGQISDSYSNMFAPSGITFSIWGLIYFLIAGFTVHLVVPTVLGRREQHDLESRTGIWFVLANGLNAAWIFAWHYEWIGVSLLLLLGLLLAVGVLFHSTRDLPAVGLVQQAFIRLPFAVYFGWVTVAVIANVTVFFVSVGWGGFGLPEAFWTVSVIGAALAIGLLMIKSYGDGTYTGVLIWALLGIIIKRLQTEPVAWSVVGAAVVSAVILTAATWLVPDVRKR